MECSTQDLDKGVSDTAERKCEIDEDVMDCGTDVNMSSKNNNFILTYDPNQKLTERRMCIRPAGDSTAVNDGVVGQVFLITEVIGHMLIFFF